MRERTKELTNNRDANELNRKIKTRTKEYDWKASENEASIFLLFFRLFIFEKREEKNMKYEQWFFGREFDLIGQLFRSILLRKSLVSKIHWVV